MSKLDLILLIPLIWGAYIGYKKGLLIELISVVVVVVAILLSFKLLTQAILIVKEFTNSVPKALPAISFVILFILLLIGLTLLGNLLKKVLHKTIFKEFDQALGAALGLLKFAFLLSNLLWVIERSESVFGKNIITESFLFPFIKPIAPSIYTGLAWIFPYIKILLNDLAIFLK